MQRKITLARLAREAGCSESQASRAVGGKPNVSPEVRAAVLEAAQRLNYRNLARNHRFRIALLTSRFSGAFVSSLLESLRNESVRLDCSCMVVDSGNIRMINEYFCDGVIAIGYDDLLARDWSAISTLPLVVINGYGLGLENICSVDPDPSEANYLALKHLSDLGHCRIARVCGFIPKRSERGRHRGGAEFMEVAARMKLTKAENIEFPLGEISLDDVIQPLLDRGITAFLVIHQHLAAEAAACIRRLGREIPRDVSLVTYELPEISEFLNPPHTTLDFDYRELARRAFQELESRIRNRECQSELSIPIANILRIRGSTSSP